MGAGCRAVAIDVGSVISGRFAWAALDLPGREPCGPGGEDPEGAAQIVVQALDAGRPVALGFEAPISVPAGDPSIADGWKRLGGARAGETSNGSSRPWAASAGAIVTALVAVQAAWVLGRIEHLRPGTSATTQPSRWLGGDADVLLWEAFVSGAGKPVPDQVSQHAADAAAATLTFADRLDADQLEDSDVTSDPWTPLNLAAAAALHGGLEIAVEELRLPCRVYRTAPAA